jgi:aerobic-type carbon monoxide dehydrogenase small subunit (CoxS/CutS family)
VRLEGSLDRAALIVSHGPDHLLTDLLGELASPTCSKVGHHLDRCGAYFVEPNNEIEARGQEDGGGDQ